VEGDDAHFRSPYTRRTMAASERNNESGSIGLNRLTVVSIALLSAVYFADIFVRASRKCFWFDELFAVYLCRLPTFKDTWAAVTHGADFNPPLFYLLIRFAQRLFGEGLIATRLPAIFGVWLFCICLFLFVARRAGAISGFIAGAFPFFTLAQYYAYEARAHGMVLGWCGLTLICWQRSLQGRARHLWLAGFGLSLTGALLTHVYAVYLLVPFAAVEVYSLLTSGRPDWRIVAVMTLVFTSVTLGVYLPLFRAYRSTISTTFAAASHDVFQRFLVNVIGPATTVLLVWVILTALERMRRSPLTNAAAVIPPREMVLAAGFACIPLAGLLGAKVSHGPFLDRYFLPSIAGYAIFLGFAVSRPRPGCWTTRVLAGFMFFLMVGDLGTITYLSMKQRIVLPEPTGGPKLSTTPSAPMKLYDTFSMNRDDLDILVLAGHEYIYFFNYAPPSVVSHLYFGAPKDDLFLTAYERLAKGAHIDFKTTTFGPFLATHSRFLVYKVDAKSYIDADQAIARAGYRFASARADAAGIMYEYTK
jgi:hypothetical protein